MPTLPIALLALHEPQAASLALPLAAASMFPLLERDGQAMPCLVLTAAAAILLPLFLPHSTGGHAVAAPASAPQAAAAKARTTASAEPATPRRPMTRLHGRQIAERLQRGEVVEIDDCAVASTSARTDPPPEPRRRSARQAASATATTSAAAAPSASQSRAENSGSAAAGGSIVSTAQSARGAASTGRPWTWQWRLAYGESMLGLVALLVARRVVEVPERLPYLHDALLTAFCFVHFAALWVYLTVAQYRRCEHAEPWAKVP